MALLLALLPMDAAEAARSGGRMGGSSRAARPAARPPPRANATARSRKTVGNRRFTLQGTNISHLGKRKIIFKMDFSGDMLVFLEVLTLDFLHHLGWLRFLGLSRVNLWATQVCNESCANHPWRKCRQLVNNYDFTRSSLDHPQGTQIPLILIRRSNLALLPYIKQ